MTGLWQKFSWAFDDIEIRKWEFHHETQASFNAHSFSSEGLDVQALSVAAVAEGWQVSDHFTLVTNLAGR